MRRPLLAWAACIAIIVGAFLLTRGTPDPQIDDAFYPLLAYKQWHPSFLGNDLTLSAPWWSHILFSRAAGLLGLVLTLEQMIWVGRLGLWSLTVVAALRLGEHFGLPLWLRSLALIVWVLQTDISVIGPWQLFRWFSAASLAGILLLFSLDALLRQRCIRAFALLGVCVSVHPTFGFWAGTAVLVAWLWQRPPGTVVVRAVVVGGVCAFPALVSVWLSAQTSPHVADALVFLVTTQYPLSMDPFLRPYREVLTMVLPVAFLVLSLPGKSMDPRLRFLTTFAAMLLVWLGLSYLFRAGYVYGVVGTVPDRALIPVALMFFLFRLARLTAVPADLPPGLRQRVLLGVVAFGILSAFHAPGATLDRVRFIAQQWTLPRSDLIQSLRWVAHHTPETTVVLAPPWLADFWYHARRAQVVSSRHVAVERFAEWRERMEALVGQAYLLKDHADRRQAIEQAYHALTEPTIQALAHRYKAHYLVASQDYSFPIVHRQGDWKVYTLPLPAVDHMPSSQSVGLGRRTREP